MSYKNAALTIHDLCVSYREQSVLSDVHCTVPQGVLCALIGPNGAGKTTFLKSILGLVNSVKGSVHVLGKPFNVVSSRVAYIPQRSSVDWDFPATVFDVVMMGRYRHIGWFWRPGAKDKKKVWDAIESVDMTAYADRPIGLLSGGQQQRVFLARALVQEADLYLMDEPFNGIDTITEQAIVTLLKHMRTQGKTVIVVHHDLQTVKNYFDWAVLLNKTIIACGPIQDVVTENSMRNAYGRSVVCMSAVQKELE